MSKYIFKTNINCIGCASQVKLYLDKLEQSGRIERWQVHPTDPDHTLEIESSKMNAEEVRSYVRNAGFEAEPKTVGGL
jgi:copper chaperone CopZ